MVRLWLGASMVGLVLLLACGDGSSTDNGAGGSLGAGGSSGVGGALGGGSGGSGGGGACLPAKTLDVTASGFSAYVIDGASNPDLTLCRGNSYTFAIAAAGHPFYINRTQGTGTSNAYSPGVTGNGTETGTLTFTVPADAPATLFYNCSLHSSMTGTIHIVD